MRQNERASLEKRIDIISALMIAFMTIVPSASGKQECVSLRIERNGKLAPAPQTVTLRKTSGGMTTVVPAENGCFQLPLKLEQAKSFDVVFQVNGETIHLRGIRPLDFAGLWRVVLEDTAFKGEFASITQNAPARAICVVIFPSWGDGTSMAQTGCRGAVKKH
jgi:hypothetical protein